MLVAEFLDLVGVHLDVLAGHELGVLLHLHDHVDRQLLLGVLHAEELERLLVLVAVRVEVHEDHLAAHLPRGRLQRPQARLEILTDEEGRGNYIQWMSSINKTGAVNVKGDMAEIQIEYGLFELNCS